MLRWFLGLCRVGIGSVNEERDESELLSMLLLFVAVGFDVMSGVVVAC